MHFDKERKKWVAQARDGEGKLRTGRFDKKEDLNEWVSKMRTERQRVRRGMRASPVSEITLTEAAALFLQHRERNAVSTTFAPEPARMKWWLSKLGNRMVYTYDNPGEIVKALDELCVEGSGIVYARGKSRTSDRGASPATRNRFRALLHTFFQHAMLNRWTTSNPVAVVPTLVEVQVRPSGHWKELKHLESYLKAAASEGELWQALATFLAFTGCRIGEAQGLQWGDIEFPNDLIVIRRIVERKSNQLVPRTKGMRAKNRAGRSEDPKPLFPLVKAALLGWREVTKFPKDGDFVFADQATGEHLQYERCRDAHGRILKASRAPKLTIHGLRHTFQRMAEKAGFARGETQFLLGHATITTTERYAGADMAHLVRRAESLGFGALTLPVSNRVEKTEGEK